MSNISSTHSVQSYVPTGAGKTSPLEGQRLSKVTYKVSKETGIKPPSKCVSIPVIGWSEVSPHVAILSGVILSMVHTAQDKIVRELVESGKSEVTDESIQLSTVIEAMIAESSGRITGDVIRGWFKESLAEPLMLAFASKLGIADNASPTPQQEKKLEQVLKGYEDSFSKLASGAATFTQLQKDNMLKALDLIVDSNDDPLIDRFVARLSKEAKNDDELLMSL